MAGRAIHFSLSDDEVEVLRGLASEERIAHLFEHIEEDYFANHRAADEGRYVLFTVSQ